MTTPQTLNELSALPDDLGANRVLVVDDDVVQRMMLVRILRKAGYDSAAAMSNEEAWSLLGASDFGLVVADLHMFAENGIELVRRLAARHPTVCSLVVSGFVSEDDRERIREAGAFDVMTKPVEQERFLQLVERAFQHRGRNVAQRRRPSA